MRRDHAVETKKRSFERRSLAEAACGYRRCVRFVCDKVMRRGALPAGAHDARKETHQDHAM